jgi:excisionase family DNA binding protein
LLPEANRAKARIGIRWHTGAADQIIIDRPRPSRIPAPTPAPATQLIRQLGPVTTSEDLAVILNQHGYRTGAGRPFDTKAVQWIRHAYHIPGPSPCRDAEISVNEAAQRLGCSPGVVYYWIETGQLTARRSTGGRLAIPWTDATETGCKERIASSGHLNPAARRTRPRQRH